MEMRDHFHGDSHKKVEGYGEEVKKINEDTFDETAKRNGEAIGSYSQKKHKSHKNDDISIPDQDVNDSYSEIAKRNEDALAEHFKPSESPEEKKSDESDKK